MERIGILDYGMGNTASVVRMVERVGGVACRISTEDEIKNSKKIILPGVGSFDHGMTLLHENNLVDILRCIVNDILLLGVCLGMQLLFNRSDEGNLPGLGLIPGNVVKFRDINPLPIPHMGWNEVDVCRENPLIPLCGEEYVKPRFYFVHSYYAVCKNLDDVIATVNYGTDVTAAVGRGNIYGVQFHPEKSHRFGMDMIRRFVEL